MGELRVGLNLLYLAPRHTGGMEIYARALVPALGEAWPDAEWIAFAPRELAGELREAPWTPRLSVVELPVRAVTRAPRLAGEMTLLPIAARRYGLDLLHSLGNTAPFLVGVPGVVTVHDLIYHHVPETHRGILGWGMARLMPMAVRASRRVITVSQSSRDDLVRYAGADPARVDVVAQGPGLQDHAVVPTPEERLRERLGLPPGPIVLSMSAKRPHKNLLRLIDAVARLEGEPVLVIPGYPHDHERELRARAAELGIGDRVALPGWMEGADLEGLYLAATCMAFPSLAEGFGLSVLEAMRRGLPVASSDAMSLPEVCGDAALLFDPRDVDAMGAAVGRLLAEPALRADLSAKGLEQAARFSWERTAAGTIATYEKVLERRFASLSSSTVASGFPVRSSSPAGFAG